MNIKHKKTNTLSTKNKKAECKKKLIIKFFSIVFSFLSIYILLSTLVFGFIINDDSTKFNIKESNKKSPIILIKDKEEENKVIIPKKTTFLIVGLDQSDLLSDVVILGVFDRDTQNINLINIPRDTFVQLSENTRNFLLNNKRRIPKETKLTNLYSYSGKKLGIETLKRYLKDEFNIEIDYHAIVDIDAFKKIVDILGPIDMEIPKGGFYYQDPTQKLKIKIPEGMQKIDGRLAEGVVRYRATYKRGDLQRIEMQQKFIMELFKQTLFKENLSNNITYIFLTIIKNVETNFKIEELYKYLPYLSKLKKDNLIMQTLPGYPKIMKDSYSGLNISYLVCDKIESKKIINNLLEDNLYINKIDDIKEYNIDCKNLNIKILNGSNKIDVEKYTKKKLEEEGFNFITIDNYRGYKTANTRIITKLYNSNVERDLKKYFNSPVFVVDEKYFTKEDKNDILIITGTLEK